MSLLLDLGDEGLLHIGIRMSTRARRIRLISGIAGVEAVVPKDFSKEELSQFAKSKQDWLLKTSRYYSKLKERCGGYEHGAIFFRGAKYRCNVVSDRQLFATVSEAIKVITFHVPDKRRTGQFQQQWYRQQTAAVISQRLPVLAARMNLKYNKVSIKKLKSRWGSCSRKGNLNFNLTLASAPDEVIDYVLIHELAHLAVLNHSPKFWALVREADPEYRSHRQWLNTFSPLIKIG